MVVCITIMLLVFASCKKEKNELVPSISSKDSTPFMVTTGVSMLISDSGITKYRVETPEWLVFDQTENPYSYFPQGVYLEKFDTLFNIEISIKADTAYYYNKKKLWQLFGNVEVINVKQNEKLSSNELFWDEREHIIYSEQLIRFELGDGSYLYGYSFEFDQATGKYTIIEPHEGEFYIKESSPPAPGDTITASGHPAVSDTLNTGL